MVCINVVISGAIRYRPAGAGMNIEEVWLARRDRRFNRNFAEGQRAGTKTPEIRLPRTAAGKTYGTHEIPRSEVRYVPKEYKVNGPVNGYTDYRLHEKPRETVGPFKNLLPSYRRAPACIRLISN